jgi:translocation and assembly module TamA
VESVLNRGCLYFALALAIFLWGQAARADDDDKPLAEIEYETRFVGADGKDLADDIEDQMKEASQLVALEDKNPASPTALRRRVEADLDRLSAVMRANGFYDAALKYDIDDTKSPEQVTITVVPGQVYTLGEVKLVTPEGGSVPDIGGFDPAASGLVPGLPATAVPVVAAEGRIVADYKHHGYPFARMADRHVVVDTATHVMAVTYVVDPGVKARFGATSIEGLDWLEPGYVERRILWKQGDGYDQALVDEMRRSLVSSGLFGVVEIGPAGPVAPDGTVPIKVKTTERPLHSVGIGASYNTTEGIAGNLSWEDRNIFGHAEDLSITGRGGTTTDGLVTKFRIPDALAYRFDFISNVTIEKLIDPAFDSTHELAAIGLEDHFTQHLVGDFSLEAEHGRLNEKVDYRVYTLVGVPLSLRWDGSNDLLNPTEGERLGGSLTPYLRALGSNENFTQAKIDGSLYRRLGKNDTYILALEGTLGTTAGASLDAIPKDHRFYTGGGGSVRGFGFQKGGPLDQFFNPIGGRSMAETSLELRTRISENIGLVPFLDAGSDYETVLPKFNAKPYVGAGIGLRYYTAIGPVRFDIATPLDPHRKGDSPIQVYVSLGQAF